ncbi:energy-coupled thiamine transporter ThiT [Bombilactobacillus folatiphilus]|uniref:Energy-coupled thiamine transporter ThiT n=1 Tax=Bombilactobacillus folatiphilus TaxID=2923362 RepID=A0ABY4P9W9_9LACO|nr:energy-coupled thiamine transporter ThiT [Bombilactobacillus folatiphilus]UQS82197.1 energy-coupled thiamine transporter ThiT [Bombilactobacillus folatiphilus]
MKKNSLQSITEGAIIVALAMVLSYIPHSVGISSIEVLYGVVPLFLYSWRRGFKAGVIAGIAWGLLDLILRGLSSGSVLNAWQGILEYPVAFGLLGLAGIWSKAIKTKLDEHLSIGSLVIISSLVALFGKYLIHFFAGVLVWGSYAPKAFNPWTWSLLVNGGSAIVTLVFVIIIMLLLKRVLPKIINWRLK